jgi:hypothetical protein
VLKSSSLVGDCSSLAQTKLPLDRVKSVEFLGETGNTLFRNCRFVQVINNRSCLFVGPKQAICLINRRFHAARVW